MLQVIRGASVWRTRTARGGQRRPPALDLAGGQRQRSLLALLLLNANRVVSTDRLVEALWGDDPPRTALVSLRNGVSQLRKLLGADVIETRPPGYVLHAAPDQIDLAAFESLVARARSEPVEGRAATLRQALALWRGHALDDLAFETFAADEIRRLEELRLGATEEWIDAELAVGNAADVVAGVEALVSRNPLRERLRALLMLALARVQRQADALQTFHDFRRMLDDELGLEPGPELRDLHRRILIQDASLRPRPVATVSPADAYGDIVRALLVARLVPVLGLKTTSAAPQPEHAAEQLARCFDCPPEVSTSLTRVAQYVAVTRGTGPLYDELDGLYGGDHEPGPVHRMLAALAPVLRARGLPHQLIVTTGYDRTLERAFAEAGEPLDVVSYIALGRDRGKFLLVGGDGAARVIAEPNVEVGLTTDSRTILLRVHGGAADWRERESYVVSEDDYIDLLAGTEPSALLPVGLAARMQRSHFLFLGYDLEDWSLRVFLRRLWGDERLAYRSWAVGSADGGAISADYWRQRGVDPLDVELESFLASLTQLLAAQTAAVA